MLLDDAVAQLECQLVRHYDGGDHTIFIAEVERGTMGEARPLLHYRGRYAQLVS
jgi:flavin reductase (DIM6/NTAB) family NADH-FMN oxidoreductase RutF